MRSMAVTSSFQFVPLMNGWQICRHVLRLLSMFCSSPSLKLLIFALHLSHRTLRHGTSLFRSARGLWLLPAFVPCLGSPPNMKGWVICQSHRVTVAIQHLLLLVQIRSMSPAFPLYNTCRNNLQNLENPCWYQSGNLHANATLSASGPNTSLTTGCVIGSFGIQFGKFGFRIQKIFIYQGNGFIRSKSPDIQIPYCWARTIVYSSSWYSWWKGSLGSPVYLIRFVFHKDAWEREKKK